MVVPHAHRSSPTRIFQEWLYYSDSYLSSAVTLHDVFKDSPRKIVRNPLNHVLSRIMVKVKIMSTFLLVLGLSVTSLQLDINRMVASGLTRSGIWSIPARLCEHIARLVL